MGNDDQLVASLNEGNSTSFNQLYKKHSGKVYNFVMKLSHGDSYLAEEIVQDVFVKVWNVRKTIDPKKSFSAFLCTIAKNMVVNIYLHKMQEIIYQDKMKNSTSFSTENTTEKDVDYSLLETYINSLIEKLPPARREIFILSRKRLMSNKEIANELKLSENTVESQITKALSFIRKEIKNNYGLVIAPYVVSILTIHQ